jgi:hypothetical protein
VLEPPKSSEIEPAKVFRELLSRVPVWPIDWKVEGVDESFFVRAIGSHEWVSLHRAIGRASFGPDRSNAEHALLARVVALADCRPAFDSPSLLNSLYDYEVDRLIESAYRGLSVVSPTYAACDVGVWIEWLKDGCMAPENWADMLSLSGCHSISFGMGKGAIHVRHEPEAFFGFPRREMLDCHWFAYRAALKAHSDLNR